MYMGEPIAQVYVADNGFVVCVENEKAEKLAETAKKRAAKDSCCPAYVPLEERTDKLVFSTIKEVCTFLTKQLPTLAKASASEEYAESFDEED